MSELRSTVEYVLYFRSGAIALACRVEESKYSSHVDM